ncbi:hypothetical protein [Burkholderia stabilis]
MQDSIVIYGIFAVFIGACVFAAVDRWQQIRDNEPSRVADAAANRFFADLRIPPFAHLLIEYVDASGAITDREIFVYHIDLRDGMLQAFCMLRMDRRTFNVRNIRQAVDMETGDAIGDLRLFLRQARAKLR